MLGFVWAMLVVSKDKPLMKKTDFDEADAIDNPVMRSWTKIK